MKPYQILILIRGIPGSGKSTLAQMICKDDDFLHYEADSYFMKAGAYIFNPRLLKEAHKCCFDQTKHALLSGLSVVVSNTFTTKKEIGPYIELAKGLNIPYNIIICQGNFGSVHNVPDETIEKMKKRFDYDIE